MMGEDLAYIDHKIIFFCLDGVHLLLREISIIPIPVKRYLNLICCRKMSNSIYKQQPGSAWPTLTGQNTLKFFPVVKGGALSF